MLRPSKFLFIGLTKICEIVNKSKFTGYALIGESREDFLSSINTIALQMPGSNHVAFAYQIKTNHGVDAYFNDAGEPSGTAGKPLLNILEKKNIVNCFSNTR